MHIPGGGFQAEVVNTFRHAILSLRLAELALAKCSGKRGLSELPGMIKSGGVQSIWLGFPPNEGLPDEDFFFSFKSLEHTLFKKAKEAPSCPQ